MLCPVPASAPDAARAITDATPGAVAGEGGDRATHALAVRLHGEGLSEEQIFDELERWNVRCEPPWDEKKLRYEAQRAANASPFAQGEFAAKRTQGEALARLAEEVSLQPLQEWQDGLIYVPTKGGQELANSASNATLILAHDAEWSGCLVFDDFAQRASWAKSPPWFSEFGRPPKPGDELNLDTHYLPTANWLHAKWGSKGIRELPKSAVQDALVQAAHVRSCHPLQEYLRGLTWDGTPRIGALLQRYFGATDDPTYLSAYGAFWFISAVARAFAPGCQADMTLILQGHQGTRKTSALRVLAVHPEWYASAQKDLGTKDSQIGLLGKWIVEFEELDALTAAELSTMRAFLTKRHDDVRPPYGRSTLHLPRSNIFAGSTNEINFLRDATGNRRFILVSCNRIALGAIERDRDQIWAEAVHRYQTGELWWATENDGELEALAKEAQENRFDVDPWEDRISVWLDDRTSFATSELMASALSLTCDRQGYTEQRRVAHILRRLGWQQTRVRQESGVRPRVWVKITASP